MFHHFPDKKSAAKELLVMGQHQATEHYHFAQEQLHKFLSAGYLPGACWKLTKAKHLGK